MTEDRPHGEVDGSVERPVRLAGWRLRGTLADKVEVLLPLLGYLAMVISGATTSSLGMLRGREAALSQWGDALGIRSDEWLTAAPLELATLANGSSMTSPLANGPDLIYQLSSGTFFETILFTEGNLLRLGPWLPDAMLFAAYRAFPWLLLALFLPPLLRRLGANRPMSWLAWLLCMLAPAALWWSFMPIRSLSFAAAGSYLLVLGTERLVRGQRWTGLALAAVAGVLLARLVSFYVPWSLTVGVPLVVATGVALVADARTRRSALWAVGAGAVVGLVVLVGTFWENWGALHAELNTVYPGLRRSTGEALAPWQLLGAPGLHDLVSHAELLQFNQSEVTSAYTITGVVAALVWPAAWPRLSRPERGAVLTLAGFCLVFVAWTTMSWGSFGESIPGLAQLMPIRTSQTMGFPMTVLMVLLLSGAARTPHGAGAPASPARRRALVAFGVTALLTGYAASGLATVLPDFSALAAWGVAVVTGLLVALVVWRPHDALPVALVALVLVPLALRVNPVLFGLGDVRTSPGADVARKLRTTLEAKDGLAVTDSMAVNALMVANGVPLLSGYQVTGPVRDTWLEIDPDAEYEGVWNRGASYLMFSFDRPVGAEPEVIEANPDIILVSTDPCWLASSDFGVSRAVTSAPLESRCAKRVGRFTFNGVDQFVYALAG